MKGVCPKCSYSYGAVTGKLEKRYSRQVTIQRKTKNQFGVYKRDYELRVLTPQGTQQVFKFQIDGKEDRIKARRTDQVTVLTTLRGGAVEDVVWQGVTRSGSTIRYRRPRPSLARSRAVAL